MTHPPTSDARFIVGMSRAGTTWVAKCLNEHPDAAVFGETLFWGRQYVEPGPDGRHDAAGLARLVAKLKHVLPLSTMPKSPAEAGSAGDLKRVTLEDYPDLVDRAFADAPPSLAPGEAFLRYARAFAEAEGKPLFIEKTPHHLNWIGRILAALPDARFAVLVRDPYDFMLSYKHQGDRQAPETRRMFDRLYHPIACAQIWRGYARAALDAAKRPGGAIHLVRFEALAADPAGEMRRIQEHFGLAPEPLHERVPPDNTSFPEGERKRLASRDEACMTFLAAREIAALGYSSRPSASRAAVAAAALTLPAWGARNLLALRRQTQSLAPYLWRWIKGPSGR